MMRAVAFLLCLLFALPALAFPQGNGSPPATLTGIAVNYTAVANVSGTGALKTGDTFYYTGGMANGTTVATLSASITGSAGFTGTYGVTGANASCFQVSGSNLQTAGSCGAGFYSFNVTATQAGAGGSPYARAISGRATATYYISPTGNDSNNGTSTGTPWLTPNHAGLYCGDTIQAAASSSYNGGNFYVGNYGTPICANADNVVMIQCITFDACKFSSAGADSDMHFQVPYWGVSGFEMSNTGGACILINPATSSADEHHVAMINSVMNGCSQNGVSLTEYQGGTGPSSNDYVVVAGVDVYNGAYASDQCYSNISDGAPANYDNAAVTHRYFGHIVSWAALDGSSCNGTNNTTDGECWILDRPDINSFANIVLVENSLFIGCGGSGAEVFYGTNNSGLTTVVYRENTTSANLTDPYRQGTTNWDIQFLAGSTNRLEELALNNISSEVVPTGGLSTATNFAHGDSYLVQNSIVDTSWFYSPSGSNNLNYNTGYNCVTGLPVTSPGAGNSNNNVCSGVTINTSPNFVEGVASFTGSISGTTLTTSGATGAAIAIGQKLYGQGVARLTTITGGSGNSWTVSVSQTISSESMAALVIPGAPSCGSAADAWACMSSTIANFTPQATGTAGLGVTATPTCDSYNTTTFILNVLRRAPADMNPCG